MSLMQRKRKSYLWRYFSVQKSDGCNKFAQCGICDRTLRFTTSVTNLKKHLERKHPTSLAASSSRRSVTTSSSAISSDVCDSLDVRVNGQDNRQHVYSSTHIVDYQTHDPVEYSSKLESVKDTTDESEAGTSMFVVGPERNWGESKNAERPTVPQQLLTSPVKENDEFDLFGMSIAAKMRKMSTRNNVQCIIAEKLISEVIFHGQLESLTLDTVVKVPEKESN